MKQGDNASGALRTDSTPAKDHHSLYVFEHGHSRAVVVTRSGLEARTAAATRLGASIAAIELAEFNYYADSDLQRALMSPGASK